MHNLSFYITLNKKWSETKKVIYITLKESEFKLLGPYH